MIRTISSVLLTAILLSAAGCATKNPIRTGHLLAQMTDLERLAAFPQPAYKTVQFSSYDRRSARPGGPGWFANSDGFGGEPIPGFEAVVREPNEEGIGEYLICDVKGPGAIVRTWTAAIGGDIHLFLDNMRSPVYAGPAADFLLCPYQVVAKEGTLDASILDGTFRQHQAAYCPIPFARRCRMIWVGNVKNVHFYHVQVRLYERGASVETFAPQDLTRFGAELRHAAQVLSDPDRACAPRAGEAPVQISAALQPGEQKDVLKINGPQALRRLTLKVAADDLDRALRQTILHVICDEHPWGQVQAPIGDFFGAAPGINPFTSLPLAVAPDGTMTCRYVMPFESSLRILLDNRGEQVVTVTGAAWPMAWTWNERSLHFRARWRVDHGVLGTHRAIQDMPFIIADGAGRFVGAALMLLNPARVSTPYGSWWGEGDEKVFIDDDVVPSTFGTGSEDYFNYAWSVPEIFAHAYCGQPRNDGPGNRGFVTNQRWHILDDLPFHERLAFYLELNPHDHVPGMSYARIAYYYARPDTMDDHVVITDEDVRPLQLPADWQPVASYGMHDSVFHPAEELVPAGPAVNTEPGNLWAGGKLVVWRPASPGDGLELRFSVDEDHKYRLHLGLALDAESGRIAAKLDGQRLNLARRDAIDLYVPHRVLARQFGSGDVELAKGEHVLVLVFEGAPESVREPRIGIDYLAVQRR